MATNYGRDISCTDSLRTGRYASGVRLVGEACYRRLITPRGKLRGGEAEANYGLDLAELTGNSDPKTLELTLPGLIASELEKDERVLSVNAVVSRKSQSNGTCTFAVAIDIETDEGPFTLQLAVSAVSVELLGITADG